MSKAKDSKSRIYDLHKYHQNTQQEYPKNAKVHEYLLSKLQEYYDKSDKIEKDLKSLSKTLNERELQKRISFLNKTYAQYLVKLVKLDNEDGVFDDKKEEERRDVLFTELIKAYKKVISAKNDEITDVQNKKTQKAQNAVDALNKELESLIQSRDDESIREELKKELKNYNRGANIAAATFVLHSKNNLPNYHLSIKMADRDLSTLAQTSMPNERFEQVSPYVGPIGKSSVNSMLYGHSEQDIMRNVDIRTSEISEMIDELTGNNRDKYELTFILASKHDTCCVCNRSIKRFVAKLSDELRMPVHSSISFEKEYHQKDQVLMVIERIKKNSNNEMIDFIRSKFDGDISDEDVNYLIARVVELGISFAKSSNNGLEVVAQEDDFDKTVLSREISNQGGVYEVRDGDIEFGFHLLDQEGQRVNFDEISFEDIKLAINTIEIHILQRELEEELKCKDISHHRPNITRFHEHDVSVAASVDETKYLRRGDVSQLNTPTKDKRSNGNGNEVKTSPGSMMSASITGANTSLVTPPRKGPRRPIVASVPTPDTTNKIAKGELKGALVPKSKYRGGKVSKFSLSESLLYGDSDEEDLVGAGPYSPAASTVTGSISSSSVSSGSRTSDSTPSPKPKLVQKNETAEKLISDKGGLGIE